MFNGNRHPEFGIVKAIQRRTHIQMKYRLSTYPLTRAVIINYVPYFFIRAWTSYYPIVPVKGRRETGSRKISVRVHKYREGVCERAYLIYAGKQRFANWYNRAL